MKRWRIIQRTRFLEARSEQGAALILALIFLAAVGMAVLALDNWTSNDLNTTSNFASARSLQYAASSTTNLAIQNIRYNPQVGSGQTLNASPPASCWSGSAPSNPSGITIAMVSYCSTSWNPASANTRVVTISTCQSSVGATSCAANPVLQAIVTFDDYPSGLYVPTTNLCVVYCGSSESVNSWVWSPVLPTVTGLSTSSGPISGGTSLTITGTGFTRSATVNFVDATLSDNVIVPATGVTYNSATSISAVAPAVTTGTRYYVTVTTAGGTSAYGPTFTYVPAAPTVTTISPTSGSTAGGTSITISGKNFVTGSTVTLTQESGGTPVSPTVTLPATVASLTATTIVASTPSVLSGGSYFVTVTTPYGTNAYSSSAIFTYSVLPPTVIGVSPTSGLPLGGIGITVTGTGFVSGATVNFVEELGGVALGLSFPATGVTVTGATTIVCTTPAVSVGLTYFVTVTTPGGTSAYSVVFTF